MDEQIVTSSLTQIQGGLSASTDEIAWVQTAYLIADVVMVPMCGFMSRLLSTRAVPRDHGRADRYQLLDADPGRAVGQYRRNCLGANRVSDCRRRHGADVRVHVSIVVD